MLQYDTGAKKVTNLAMDLRRQRCCNGTMGVPCLLKDQIQNI